MQHRPSKRVRRLFDEVEALGLQLEDLTLEEERLHATLEKLWRSKTLLMANLASKAQEATTMEASEHVKKGS
jgi:hypothetical protein